MKKIIFVSVFLCFTFFIKAQGKGGVYSRLQYISFLKDCLKGENENPQIAKEFNQQSKLYWKKNKLEYNQNPTKFKKEISLYYKNKDKFKRNNSRDLNRYKKTLENFQRFDNRNTLANNPVLFIGSSSIAGWETSKSFPNLPVINRGIGGISLSEITYYYNDIVKKYAPKILVIYCDIDVEIGKSPAVAVNAFKVLVNKVKIDFPKTQVIILPMKPTLIDDFIGEDIRKNKNVSNEDLTEYCKGEKNVHFVDITPPMLKPNGSLLSEIFLDDGMHLNKSGYDLWDPIVREKIKSLLIYRPE
ncbi:GDSL-type esterase/lipase family protein [Lutibacter citreus]|uniref:GDSL-type esterase/lipase family protein n=1 Tax=Lutibacter citreus TaxID=2138210 RepID=UPI000DBE4A40|nr:GDSL-type esterase/lipase family protein [Lutibacter citreus]